MTGWAGAATQPERQPEQLGLIDSLVVILLPWLDRQAGEQADPPCLVIREPEAQ
jgi:hypothetical protein